MIPKQVIEKAIEGGWQDEGCYRWSNNTNQSKIYVPEFIALDPTFWQALGKALGWKKKYLMAIGDNDSYVDRLEWHMKAREFYDLILTGGDTEAFWQELLATHK